MRDWLFRQTLKTLALNIVALQVGACFTAACANPIDGKTFAQAYRQNDFKLAAKLARECMKQEPGVVFWKTGLVQAGLNGGCSLNETEAALRLLKPSDDAPGKIWWYWQLLEEQRKDIKRALFYANKLNSLPAYRDEESVKRYSYFRHFSDDNQALQALANHSQWSGLSWLISKGHEGTRLAFTKAVTAMVDEKFAEPAIFVLKKLGVDQCNAAELGLFADSMVILKKPATEIITLDKDIIRRYPADSQAVLLAAKQLAAYGNFTDSWNGLNNIANDNQFNEQFWTLKSAIAFKRGDIKTAESCISNAIRLNPKDPGYYITRASLRGFLSQKRGMLDDLGIIIELKPSDISWRIKRADAYKQQKMFPEALADYEEIIKLCDDKERTRLLIQKAQLQDVSGDVKGALGTLSLAKKRNAPAELIEPLEKALLQEAKEAGI